MGSSKHTHKKNVCVNIFGEQDQVTVYTPCSMYESTALCQVVRYTRSAIQMPVQASQIFVMLMSREYVG